MLKNPLAYPKLSYIENKWFPWAFWWNLFEFFCNGDLPMTFAAASLRSAEPRWSLASLDKASLRSAEPRFARRDGLASLRSAGGLALLCSAGGLSKRYTGKKIRANPPGVCTPHLPLLPPHGPPLKILWTFGSTRKEKVKNNHAMARTLALIIIMRSRAATNLVQTPYFTRAPPEKIPASIITHSPSNLWLLPKTTKEVY